MILETHLEHETRLARNMALVVGWFIFCWFPVFLQLIFGLSGNTALQNSPYPDQIDAFMTMSNSFGNPILFAWVDPTLRGVIRSFFTNNIRRCRRGQCCSRERLSSGYDGSTERDSAHGSRGSGHSASIEMTSRAGPPTSRLSPRLDPHDVDLEPDSNADSPKPIVAPISFTSDTGSAAQLPEPEMLPASLQSEGSVLSANEQPTPIVSTDAVAVDLAAIVPASAEQPAAADGQPQAVSVTVHSDPATADTPVAEVRVHEAVAADV